MKNTRKLPKNDVCMGRGGGFMDQNPPLLQKIHTITNYEVSVKMVESSD